MTKYRKIVHVKNYQHRNTANFLILMVKNIIYQKSTMVNPQTPGLQMTHQ